jgi:NAD(P)H-dependent flavin oxidoreductase YrpB (nitropropane dioxygenase family)
VRGVLGWTPQTGAVQLEVAFEFDIALLASALGPPPEESIREAHARDIPVSALVGRVDQALKQRDQGVDIIVAQGTEAGGHTGEIGGMVLTPEVVDASPRHRSCTPAGSATAGSWPPRWRSGRRARGPGRCGWTAERRCSTRPTSSR